MSGGNSSITNEFINGQTCIMLHIYSILIDLLLSIKSEKIAELEKKNQCERREKCGFIEYNNGSLKKEGRYSFRNLLS